MHTLRFPLGKLVLVGCLLLIFLHASAALSNADVLQPAVNTATPAMTYGIVGPGRYEAECATLTPSNGWAFRKSKRASKGSGGCATSGNTNYIESAATTSAVCLNFKNASRVGIGYVAGYYKGKASVKLYNASGGLLDTKPLNAYDAYIYPEGSSNAADTTAAEIAAANGEDLYAADDTLGAYEGDVDTAAPDATMTFWAYKWMWSSETMSNFPATGKICISPKNIGTLGAMVSLDYFVVGSGNKMGLRGMARYTEYMTPAATGMAWNYNGCGWEIPTSPGCPPPPESGGSLPEGYIPAVGSTAWEGFVPKVHDPSNWAGNPSNGYTDPGDSFKVKYVYPVIEGARQYGGGANTFVPKYWIIFNEHDMAGLYYFWIPRTPQLPPEAPEYLHGMVNVMQEILEGYADKGVPAPKIILETGSQVHAPGNTNTFHWSGNGCGDIPEVDWPAYWGCTHDGHVWIADFWTALSTDMNANPSVYPLSFTTVQQTVGGFSGHYYPTADGACQLPSCYLNTQRIVQFVDALKNWKNTNGFADRELWLTETSTHVTNSTVCLNIPKDPDNGYYILSVNEQRDSFKCQKTSKPNTYKHYNVRNYVGKLQEALAAAGVNRWAWYAERWYGGANPCPTGVVMRGLGEETALNAACDRYTESPFGNNFSLAAPYR